MNSNYPNTVDNTKTSRFSGKTSSKNLIFITIVLKNAWKTANKKSKSSVKSKGNFVDWSKGTRRTYLPLKKSIMGVQQDLYKDRGH